ncbi:DUF4446 family protein [Clostridium sp. MB40-C1]|uniref:DUF4446 family protein n=1 Tax=Clostridium sp. MB40-C1 TaxID=3070996 RepID=UPI0027E1CE91|nr:DUF4446 family protein [Clostridium sp. MB40-C1]WMJ80084.1 DUF4446 family protein [Clostridium sp. MB40-C1]
MTEAISIFKQFQPYITIILIVAIIALLIGMSIMAKSINRLEAKYRKLTRGVNNKNLEEVVVEYLDNIDSVKADTEEIKKQQEELSENLRGCIQKVSVMRYKAFDDIGSDLSFSIALLNDDNDGVILTGIYGREDSTVYAKPVDKGISRYDLSEEEKQVLRESSNQ